MDRPSLVAALRARIGRLERAGAAAALARAEAGAIPLAPAIDRALADGGLARAALHEILAAEPGAATGFAALALARSGGTVLWIAPEPDAWPSGLKAYGLLPERLVLVRAPRPVDALWAMEEALRCPAVTGALLDMEVSDLTAARRLQLAAEAGGAIGLLLRPDTPSPGPTAALTRWRLAARPGEDGGAHHLGDPSWQAELLRGRGSRPQSWPVTWRASQDLLDIEGAGAAPPAVQRRRA
jgi:protein ImuA